MGLSRPIFITERAPRNGEPFFVDTVGVLCVNNYNAVDYGSYKMIPELMFMLVLIAGTLYGLVIGIIPSAGATTGLVALIGFMHVFVDNPYYGVIFLMATVAASTTGDTYAGVLLGIPGANSAAATMMDGHPLAKRGYATYALSAAITTSTINGLLWGTLTFMLLPWYSGLILILGIPEMWGLMVLALATVSFVSSQSVWKSAIAVVAGLVLGAVGINPITGVDRYTLGWDYLADGIQIMPMVAGLFAIPELLSHLRNPPARNITAATSTETQTIDGLWAVWKYKWDALRGGLIGAVIGLLPGVGGAVSDWLSYGSTVALNPNESFGDGNIRGVIAPEGSNNAQKATSMIPTVLFGIPGASFAAILLALFAIMGFEMGTPALIEDTMFFNSMTFGFLGGTVLVAIICLIFTRHISKLLSVSPYYYIPVVMVFIIWSNMLYTGGWEDFMMLVICSVVGMLMKHYKFSRPAMLLAFILSYRVETLSIQLNSLYSIDMLINRPIFIAICIGTIGIGIAGIMNKQRISYA